MIKSANLESDGTLVIVLSDGTELSINHNEGLKYKEDVKTSICSCKCKDSEEDPDDWMEVEIEAENPALDPPLFREPYVNKTNPYRKGTVEYILAEIVHKYSMEYPRWGTTTKYLALDSLDLVDIAIDIENEWDIEISNEEADILATKNFGCLLAFVKLKIDKNDKSVEKTLENDENDKFYNRGVKEGSYDRTTKVPFPRFLPGDQEGADSSQQAQYIDGYISGYKDLL